MINKTLISTIAGFAMLSSLAVTAKADTTPLIADNSTYSTMINRHLDSGDILVAKQVTPAPSPLTISVGTSFSGEFVYTPSNRVTSAVVGSPFIQYQLKYGFSLRGSALVGVNSQQHGTAGYSAGLNWNWAGGANTKQALSLEGGVAQLYSPGTKSTLGLYFGFNVQG